MCVVRLEAKLDPNKLCDYLFETYQKLNQFNEQCPVIGASSPEERRSRADLCGLTTGTLKLGLGLLGIGALTAYEPASSEPRL